MLMAGTGTEAFAQCYTKNLQQAESLYKQGRYAEAKKRFAAAKACPDKPKTNNLDSRIAACNRKNKRAQQYAAVAPSVNTVDHIADKLV